MSVASSQAPVKPTPAGDRSQAMTHREALRLAHAEELERDESVLLIGEEVGVFEGAYKVSAGLLERFGPDRGRDTAISEEDSSAPELGQRWPASARWSS